MINIDKIDIKPYIINIKEGGDNHTTALFLRLLEVQIHNLRIQNDTAVNSVLHNQGAINELINIINIFKPKPERRE